MSYTIAIDGPAGAGKSTIARQVARELDFIYVDTGAMYRAIALYFLRRGTAPDDAAAIAAGCRLIDVTIHYENGEQRVLLNGEDVSASIRTEEVGNMASRTSAYPEVREKLVALQRRLAASENVVMDGRDIGTKVLPDATVKIYLTASVEERARRRYREMKDKGMEQELSVIREDIRERDYRDMTRAISPLVCADDAERIDTSDLTIDEACAAVVACYRRKTARTV